MVEPWTTSPDHDNEVADEQTGTDLKQIIRDVQYHDIDVRGHHGLETTPKGRTPSREATAACSARGPR